MSQRFSPLTPFGTGLVLVTLFAGYGCKKEEPPPPMPSAAPAPTPTPTEPLTLVPEAPAVDAGPEVPDAGVHHSGTGGGASGLAKCCAALNSNAALAPSPNKEYLQAAAQACSIAVGAGASNAAVLAAVQGALRGAGMPASCK
ncbi:MAG TPA: acyltransferase [Polyangiaceae bacterium]|nr:acyltransferase [Polyangiaceae bacterium]